MNPKQTTPTSASKIRTASSSTPQRSSNDVNLLLDFASVATVLDDYVCPEMVKKLCDKTKGKTIMEKVELVRNLMKSSGVETEFLAAIKKEVNVLDGIVSGKIALESKQESIKREYITIDE